MNDFRRQHPWKLLGLGLIALGGTVLGCAGDTSPAESVSAGQHEEGEHGHDDHESGHDEHGPEGVVMLSEAALERIELATGPAAVRPLAETVSTTGEVGFDERRIARVAPRLAGRLHRVDAELGARVDAGQVLAVVDSVVLGEAKAEALRARAHYGVAEERHRRERELFADRIVSEQEVLEAEAAAREARADLVAAEQTLRLYGLSDDDIAGLEENGASASLHPVYAPFAGRVVEKHAVRGELVDPSHRLFTVADLSTVWIWIDVYERDLRRVTPGDPVDVRLDAWPEETFAGRLVYLGDRVHRETRTVRARVDLANPEGRLRPGMFARVRMESDGGGSGGAARAREALTVPETSLQRHDDGSVVFLARGGGRFERREVETGRRSGGFVEILSGLEPGDEVVTRGAFLLESQASEDQLGGHHHH